MIVFSVTPSLLTMSCDPGGPVSQFNTLLQIKPQSNNRTRYQDNWNPNTSRPPVDGIITVLLWVV